MFLFCLASVQGNAAPAAHKPSQQAAAYDQGKKIFASRCAKCHNEDANKKRPDGSTLLARLAKSNDPRRLLGTRVKDTQEREAVMEYVRSLLSRSTRENEPRTARPE